MKFKHVEKMRTVRNLEQAPARSAWARGVKDYAIDMAEEIGDNLRQGMSRAEFDALALNGAATWQDYSWGGMSLIYNEDIAAKLCTPSELARTKGGKLNPNSREQWLDTQARALFQAADMVWQAFQK